MNTPASTPRTLRTVVASLFVLLLCAALCWVLVWKAPTTAPEEKVRPPKVVKTMRIEASTERITVSAYGTVIPAREVLLRPEVGGRIVQHHKSLVPGGHIAAGEELVKINPADYQLLVTEQQAALEEAQFELELERGRQVVASREWRLLAGDLKDSETNRSLVLREPHLRRAKALVKKAQNEIAKATLNLQRTAIPAPFNTLVLQESVEIGQLVESGNLIATLAGTDEFWVRVAVPVEQLRWIALPGPDQKGAVADVLLETGNGAPVRRRGTVTRLLGDLETSGRMARVLISVPDPLGLKDTAPAGKKRLPLLLGSYVRVEIDAGELKDVLAVDRTAIREGNRIWVVGADQRLQIREVTVLWSHKNKVIILNCLEPGESLVVSGLRVALPGMRVSPQETNESATARPSSPSD